tara:strand:+ start:3690 stop:5396 length:1707 start_codon:yes stop_codon:yes gene_type:complete
MVRKMVRQGVSLNLTLLVFLLVGCAESINTSEDENTETDAGITSLVSSVENGEGITTTHVDATADDTWVYFSLESGLEVVPLNPDEGQDWDAEWDLAFQRFKIKSNGGISGTGGVEIARLPTVDFDTLEKAPEQGYLTDADDSDDQDQDPDYVFLGATPWFDYDGTTHILTPADMVYVIRSVSGQYYKFQMLNYYDDAGTSGHPSFRWGLVEAPSGTGGGNAELTVDASTENEWSYMDMTTGLTLAPASPETSLDWDIAFSRTQIKTNSGVSGAGLGGAMIATGTDWDAMSTSPTVGFSADEMVPLPGPPGSGEFAGNSVLSDWYDYDMETHVVSPKAVVFLVRKADGTYAKLQILSYDDGVFTLKTESVEREVEVHSNLMPSSSEDEFVYFRFDKGIAVEPESPESTTNWDIAISRTKFQTNSGTSGSGEGGAVESGVANLADVNSAPDGSGCYLMNQGHVCDCEMSLEECTEASGIWTSQCECEDAFAVDEMLAVWGMSAMGEYSGNPVLDEWYDYDMSTHAVTPKDTSFIVRTAEGNYVKMKVTDYVDGEVSIDWSYAGPGRTDF